jgi:hypothetical protein
VLFKTPRRGSTDLNIILNYSSRTPLQLQDHSTRLLSPSPRLPPIMRILWRTCVLPAEADLVLNSASRRSLNWKHTALYFKIKVSTIRSDSDSKSSVHPGSETPTWQRASFYTRRPSAMSCFIEVPYSRGPPFIQGGPLPCRVSSKSPIRYQLNHHLFANVLLNLFKMFTKKVRHMSSTDLADL